MKLYVSPRAPNPRRVLMFLVEKGTPGFRVSRALERRLKEQSDDYEQRDVARKGHPLKRHIGDDELGRAGR